LATAIIFTAERQPTASPLLEISLGLFYKDENGTVARRFGKPAKAIRFVPQRRRFPGEIARK
jgi:hypothetical protein